MLKCKIYVKFFLISENMGVVSLDEAEIQKFIFLITLTVLWNCLEMEAATM